MYAITNYQNLDFYPRILFEHLCYVLTSNIYYQCLHMKRLRTNSWVIRYVTVRYLIIIGYWLPLEQRKFSPAFLCEMLAGSRVMRIISLQHLVSRNRQSPPTSDSMDPCKIQFVLYSGPASQSRNWLAQSKFVRLCVWTYAPAARSYARELSN